MTTGLLAAVGQATNNLGLFAPTYQQTFQLTTEQLRTLNSVPVTLITPPNATSIVIVLVWVQASNAVDVGFSGVIRPVLTIGSLNSSGINFSGAAVVVAENDASYDMKGVDYEAASAIGAPLTVASAADRTDGDGTVLTLTITYQLMDLDGLI